MGELYTVDKIKEGVITLLRVFRDDNIASLEKSDVEVLLLNPTFDVTPCTTESHLRMLKVEILQQITTCI
jgi:hypothetical protein